MRSDMEDSQLVPGLPQHEIVLTLRCLMLGSVAQHELDLAQFQLFSQPFLREPPQSLEIPEPGNFSDGRYNPRRTVKLTLRRRFQHPAYHALQRFKQRHQDRKSVV